MPPGTNTELALLKAFEGALREGLLLDETLGGILDAALAFFDASAVALLPAGDAPAMSRSSRSIVASAAEQRLCQHLGDVLAQGRAQRIVDSGLAIYGAPAKVNDQIRGAFGIAASQSLVAAEREESVRLFARTISHVLERDRTLATLLKRREEAVALFELAAGALHSLNADEVIRLTVASLSRELEFDRVKAYRYDADAREIEEILSQGDTRPGVNMRQSLDSEEILVRCLSAHGPAFEDAEETGGVGPQRRRMALPIQAGSTVFGFLVMSRRGSFVLTPQEMRLAQELAKLTAGALERSRLIEAERLNTEQVALANQLRSALGGLTEVEPVMLKAVEKLGPHFNLDLCTVRLLASGDLPGAAASFVRPGLGTLQAGEEIPEALMGHLAAEGSHVLLSDIMSDPMGLSLIPSPSIVKNLPRPISLLAVPIAYQGARVGVIAAVIGGRPRGFGQPALRSFKGLAVELSLAISSARLLERERESVRFLARLSEVGRPLTTTFDAPRIKQILCEQALSLFGADAAQFWDADSQSKSLQISARSGEGGGDLGRGLAADRSTSPVVRAFLEKTPVVAEEPSSSEPGPSNPMVRSAVVPLTFQDELIGLLSVERRRGTEPWSPAVSERLSLLADKGAVGLHNARLMKIIEQQTERDSQTGLYNRTSVLRRLESEIRRAERSGQALAIAHIRLQGLNDAIQKLGASFGDVLLPKAAAAVVRATRAVNIVGRDRSDRFWILIFEANKQQALRAIQVIQKNFDANMADVRLQSAGISLRLTAGIASYPEDAFDTPSLVVRAEEALDEANRAGPGAVVLYGAMSAAEAPPAA